AVFSLLVPNSETGFVSLDCTRTPWSSNGTSCRRDTRRIRAGNGVSRPQLISQKLRQWFLYATRVCRSAKAFRPKQRRRTHEGMASLAPLMCLSSHYLLFDLLISISKRIRESRITLEYPLR